MPLKKKYHFLIGFALAVAFVSFVIGNFVDNLFVSKSCTPQQILILTCGALGIAGATPIGLLGSLVSALVILAIAIAYGYTNGMRKKR